MSPERFIPTTRMDPVALGMLLGLVNTLVIAAGLNAMENVRGIAIAGNVFAYGFLPATFVGAMLGAQAYKSRHRPIWLRRVMLVPPAFALVFVLGHLFQCPQYIYPSLVPTLAAALFLEQRTRESCVPVARVSGRS